MAISLGELAVRYGCELHGDPDTLVQSVGTIEAAESGAISFLANAGYRKHLEQTRATAVILSADLAGDCPVACLVTDNPYLTYARIAKELHPPAAINPGIHSSAVCGAGTRVPESAEIGAGAVLGDNVTVGERVRIGPNCVVENDAVLGADSWLVANTIVCRGVRVGERCILHPGAVIGSDGFGNAQSAEGWVKVPQVGSVSLGDDVEVGSNSTIDRGAIEDTILGNGVRIDNLCQIGHNVVIGDHTAMAAMSGVSGSTTIGARCMIGGQTGISGHLTIADDVYLLASSGVAKSITEPGTYASMFTVEAAGTWRRLLARFKRLDAYAKQIKNLEDKLKKLEN